jgi:hypothetical protein
MTPRAKGIVWRYVSVGPINTAGWALIIRAHGPWHEMVLWLVIAIWLANGLGSQAEAYALAKIRVAEGVRRTALLRAEYERVRDDAEHRRDCGDF